MVQLDDVSGPVLLASIEWDKKKNEWNNQQKEM